MAYKLNIGKVANQAKAPVKMVGSPMQQKDLNFKGNDGSKPMANAKVQNSYTYDPDKQSYNASGLKAFMNQPITSMKKKGFNLDIPKVNAKNTVPGAVLGAINSFRNNTADVKSGKQNVDNTRNALNTATNTTNSFQNSSQFQNSQSLYDSANSIMNNYPGCGWNGMECLPTTNAIQSGNDWNLGTWENFTGMANVDAGNQTWQNYTASTPENYQSAQQIKDNLKINQDNISNQNSASSAYDSANTGLKSAKGKRIKRTIGGAVVGAGLNYLANAGLKKVKEKIKQRKENKSKPKFD